MQSRLIAVEGDTPRLRVEVVYGDPIDRVYRDRWVLRFASDGRCCAFEEGPFWPGRAARSG